MAAHREATILLCLQGPQEASSVILGQIGPSQGVVLSSPGILIGRGECLLPRLSLMALHHHLPLWVGLGWLYRRSWQAAHANGYLCVHSKLSGVACSLNNSHLA